MNLTELAKDPFAFDTVLATEHMTLAKARAALAARLADVCKAAGARKVSTRNGLVWNVSYDAAYTKVRADGDPQGLLVKVTEAHFAISEIERTIEAMDEAYTGWTRFFPSITKSHPHIHRSLACRTLHADTQMRWEPSLSGHSDAEAVAKLDEALCSVCFPDAPVALHEYVSKRSQAEQAQRQAEKDARDAAKAAKTLTDAEVFRATSNHDRITTVAACKELIRDAIEAEVELEWINQPARDADPNYPADMLARMRANRADRLAALVWDAGLAASVLMLREHQHEGHGASMEAIAKIRTNKEKSARKEWGLA